MTSPTVTAALPKSSELEAMLRTAVAAVEEAGAFIRAQTGGLIEFRGKGTSGDVVSELDVRAEQLIVRRLREAHPEIPVLAEESGYVEAVHAKESPWLWLVDPLDGTNNLAIGLPAYVVGIALCRDGEPVASAVHEPQTGRTWQAYRGGRLIGPADRPRPWARNPDAARKPVVAWTQGYAVEGTDAIANAMKAVLDREARRTLSLWAPLLGWTMLARGDIDVFIGHRPQLIDLPGGLLLAQEAGLEVRTPAGAPFVARLDRHTEPDADLSFVCAAPELMSRALEWTRQARCLAPELARVFKSFRP